jgi:transposase
MKKEHITLSENDKQELTTLLSKGSLKAKTYKRALALLELDKGKTQAEVSELVGISAVSVNKWCQKYKAEGLLFLYDKPRKGRSKTILGEDCAKIVALACSNPPEGRAKWTLRLLADKLVELDLVEDISYTSVRSVLKKMN